MQKTLERMINGINSVTEIKKPGRAIGKGEIVIGKIDDVELQKFYNFFTQTSDECDRLIKKNLHSLIDTPPIHEETDSLKCPSCKILAEISSEKGFSDAVTNMFWTAVKESLTLESKIKLATTSSIGLRSDWEIVLVPQEGVGLLDILSMLTQG